MALKNISQNLLTPPFLLGFINSSRRKSTARPIQQTRNTQIMKFSKLASLPLVAFALSATSSNAVVVFGTGASGPFTPSTTTDEIAFAGDVSNTDLLHGVVGTGGAWNGGTDPNNLNNGVPGSTDSNVNVGGALGESTWTVAGTGSVREFVIGAGDNGLGYDITEVQTIAAWQGAGFQNQRYEIYLRPLGGAYSLYATVDYQPSTSTAANTDQGGATIVKVTDDAGLLDSGIDAIRFNFLDTVSNPAGGGVYRELDVFGSSTVAVPEPSSVALLGLGGLALLRRRRK